MHRPSVDNAREVIAYVRRHGSIRYRRVPDDFAGWRLSLRQRARMHGIRVSVRRSAQGYLIENRDWAAGVENTPSGPVRGHLRLVPPPDDDARP